MAQCTYPPEELLEEESFLGGAAQLSRQLEVLEDRVASVEQLHPQLVVQQSQLLAAVDR